MESPSVRKGRCCRQAADAAATSSERQGWRDPTALVRVPEWPLVKVGQRVVGKPAQLREHVAIRAVARNSSKASELRPEYPGADARCGYAAVAPNRIQEDTRERERQQDELLDLPSCEVDVRTRRRP